MKKVLAFALTLALLLGLGVPALAFSAQRSAQNLTVDGKAINCEKYNIDGSNYFKLRDLAQLLNGTGSQFDVGWDGNKGVVSITTSHAYTSPNGTELVVGADQSATAQLSAQTIMIDGQVRSDLTVYNIGGSNFFKLRELGTALGFDVDYNADTNTAVVASRGQGTTAPLGVKVRSKVTITDADGNVVEVSKYTYDSRGNRTRVEFIDANGNLSSYFEWKYNAQDQAVSEKDVSYFSDGGSYESSDEYFYDAAGNRIKTVSDSKSTYTVNGSPYTSITHTETTSTFDDAGKELTRTQLSTFGGDASAPYGINYVFSYDASGNCVGETVTDTDGNPSSSTVMTYDSKGNCLTSEQTSYQFDGTVYGTSTTVNTYDERGNRLSSNTTSIYGENVSSNSSVSTFDDVGRTLTYVSTYSDGSKDESTYTYTAEGFLNTVARVSSRDGYRLSTYEYITI